MSVPLALEIGLGISALFLITFFGLSVYLRNPKSITHKLFLFLVLLQEIHIIANYFSLHSPLSTPENQLFWIRVVMAIGALVGPTVFFLSYAFPKEKIDFKKSYLILILTVSAASFLASLSPYLYQGIEYNNGVAVPIPGPAMPIYFLDPIALFLASFVVLIIKYKKSFGTERMKNLYLLLGLSISFSSIIIFTLVSILILKTSAFVFMGPLFPVVLVGFVGYAIIKHHFLDIQPIIARTVSYTFLIILIAVIYVSALFIGSSIVTKTPLATEALFISIVLTTVIALTFQPMQSAISKLTDRIFFTGLYNPEKLLSDLSHIMSETINFNDLTAKILKTLIQEMRVTKAAFLILDDHRIKEIRSSGFDEKELLRSPLETLIHKELQSEMHSFIFQDLNDDETKNLFRRYEIEVLIPIKVEKSEVAILILGPKASGNMYSGQDLGLLDVFSSEAGIAIQNARLYTDLKITSEAKSRFVSVVSHQLRTPITVIRWSLEMLKQNEGTEKDRRAFLDNSYQGVVFLGEQLDDILIALDIYDKKVFLKKDLCNLHELFKELTPEFLTLIRTKKLNIHYDIGHDTNLVKADYGKLKKVLKILFKNALIYSSSGGQIKITSRLEEKDSKKRIVVSISDQGIGITESERDHIFEEFFRSDTARTILPNGLGLGMFVAQSFIKAHDGEIWFFSQGRDKGADFHFALPIE